MDKGLYRIVGNSGSGKTTKLYQILLEKASKKPQEHFFLLVPEQYTLQAQKDIVANSMTHGTLNIDIVSFMRLSYRIFEELGTSVSQVLEDHGKSMLLRKVLGQLDGSLRLYNNMMDKAGFIDQIKSCLSEFFQYQITEDDLQKLMESNKEQLLLQYKLEDLCKIYLAFQQALGEQYQVSEQMLSLLAQVAPKSKLLKGAHFFLDGYTGFTPVQYQLLQVLMQLGGECYITFTMDEKTYQKVYCQPHQMFFMSKHTYEKIGEMYASMGECGGEIEDITLFTRPFPRYQKCDDLGALEQHLFRYPVTIYDGEVSHIQLTEAMNMRSEVAWVAHKIREYVRTGNYRYRDIAVVSASEESYASVIRQEFSKYQIAFFLDHNTEVMNHPFVEALRSVLAIVCNANKGYTYEKMMRYLHTGLSGVSDEDVEKLDNYIVATNTIGMHFWKNGFKKIPKSMWIKTKHAAQREEKEKERQAYLAEINAIRSNIMSRILPLQEALEKEVKIKDKAAAIFQYLVVSEYQDKLEEQEEILLNEGKFEEAKVYGKIYDAILELLDKLVDILGEETDISNEELASILDAGLQDMAVGVVPSTMDQVVVGDFMRTRLHHIKILFVLGMNDAYLPAKAESPNVLTNRDRLEIAKCGVELAPDGMQSAYQEQFYLYLMLTKPNEQLYLSYARINGKGESMGAANIITKIAAMFPNMPKQIVQREVYLDTKETIYAYLAEGMKDYLQGRNRPDEKPILALYKMCRDQENYRDIYYHLHKALGFQNEEQNIGELIARQLYGENILASVTRMEQYAACAYAHFLKYGLGLQKREEYGFAVLDFGSIIHTILELFGKKVKYNKELSYQTMTQEQLETLTKECVDTALEEGGYDFTYDGARQQYIKNTILRMAKRTLKVVCRHLQLGSFEPEGFELTFGPGKTLDGLHFLLGNNASLALQGSIDRLDIKEIRQENIAKAYLKVTDYKTGNKKFDITLAYYGLQMQLLTYMLVALRAGNTGELHQHIEGISSDITQYEPGALLYYHVQDPLFENEKTLYALMEKYQNQELTKEQYETERNAILQEVTKDLRSKFRMDGLVNDDGDVLDALELPENKASYAFESISVSYNKDGQLKAASKCQNAADLHTILDYTEKQIETIGTEIMTGQNTMNPYQYDGVTPCGYCAYCDICQFDERNGNQYRLLEEKKIQDFVSNPIDADKEEEEK